VCRIGPSTIAKAYRLLRSILATAVDDEMIVRNPCRIKLAGTEVSSERPILTPAEVARLAGVIEPRYRLVVLLAVCASLLWGELTGLRRSDIDLEAMRLTVCRSVSESAAGWSSKVEVSGGSADHRPAQRPARGHPAGHGRLRRGRARGPVVRRQTE